jgi:tetratricopeptide (TPR) repeat protein
VFAHDDAAKYLQQAITAAEELDRPTDRLELMEQLGDLMLAGGGREQTIRAYEDALQFWKSLPAASNVDGARLSRKLGEVGTRWATYNPRTREHITEGLRLLEDLPDHPERVKLIIARAFDLYWLQPEAECDYATAEESAREAYRLAEAIGALQEMSAALDALAGIYLQTNEFLKMLDVTQKRSPIVEQLNDPRERVDLHRMLGFSYEQLGNYAEAVKHCEHAYQLASRSGLIIGYSVMIADAARTYMKWDRWEAAVHWSRLYDETASRRGVLPQQHWTIACRAVAAANRGDLEEARRQADEFERFPGGHPGLARMRSAARLLTALAIDEHEKSRVAVEEGLRLADTPAAKLEIHTLVLQFASQAREWSYIDQLGSDTLDRARRSGGRYYIALNCRSLGIHRREHGRLDEAEVLLKEAEDLFRALDCRWQLGKTLRELALLRRAQGRADDAARLLQEALTHFEALRALPDVERTRALM